MPIPRPETPERDSLEQEPLVVPPINFSLVARGLYRSGHPNHKNLTFLKRMNLRTVVYLEDGDYRKDAKGFVEAEGCKFWQFPIGREEALFTDEGKARIHDALKVVLDTSNHPLLVHDDSGKSTSTLLISLIRCLERWNLTGIFAEGDMFAGPAGGSEGGGVGETGREFIALFDPKAFKKELAHTVDKARWPEWLT